MNVTDHHRAVRSAEQLARQAGSSVVSADIHDQVDWLQYELVMARTPMPGWPRWVRWSCRSRGSKACCCRAAEAPRQIFVTAPPWSLDPLRGRSPVSRLMSVETSAAAEIAEDLQKQLGEPNSARMRSAVRCCYRA